MKSSATKGIFKMNGKDDEDWFLLVFGPLRARRKSRNNCNQPGCMPPGSMHAPAANENAATSKLLMRLRVMNEKLPTKDAAAPLFLVKKSMKEEISNMSERQWRKQQTKPSKPTGMIKEWQKKDGIVSR